MNKKELQRKTAKQFRLGIKKELYQAYSDEICKKIIEAKHYDVAKNIMIYCPIMNEVDTSLLLENCIKNKVLVLPRTSTEAKKIIPCIVKDIADLKSGRYSILEPNEECEEISLEKVNIVILPLLAFDKNGNRLGYGGGYYDKLLSKENNCIKIGIAFSIQEIDFVEVEDHDMKLDMIITEKEILCINTALQ